jgi:hypothetical protein
MLLKTLNGIPGLRPASIVSLILFTLHGFGNLRDGEFRFWSGIQSFVSERRSLIAHDLILLGHSK